MTPAFTTREAIDMVAREIADCLSRVSCDELEVALENVARADRIFITGAGRSGLAMRGFAMRLMHLGKTAYVVGETSTPGIAAGDLLIIGSGSGRTASLLTAAGKAREIGARLLLFTLDAASPLAALADDIVVIPASSPKAASTPLSNPIHSVQPMGTLFEQALLLVLDACVLRLMQENKISSQQMFARHANLE
jgi:6-phospho-3-hexuloisomerase